MRAVDFWLGATGILSGISVPLYLFVPHGTVKHFGGEVSGTAAMWCTTVAAGDALCSYLSYHGIRAKTTEAKRLCIRSVGIYALLHMGIFHYGHTVLDPQPNKWQHIPAVAMSLAALCYWGIFRPPTVENEEHQD
mmetsp:Transcript_8882/g.20361  ORF Transcript_8882/g.20361 Transcript_8882/m.20361 type:complete len:135 (-) Transcript_8882:1807-2211(-)